MLDYVLLDDVRREENSCPPRHVTFRVGSLVEKFDEERKRRVGSRKAGKTFHLAVRVGVFVESQCPGLIGNRVIFYFKNEKKRFMRATGAENFDLILFSNFENFSNFADFGKTSRRVSASRKLGVSLHRATTAH